tara:strand:- start:11927 stop:12310 length:384 start_codon:yes stop_codon:yes gene_type:complete
MDEDSDEWRAGREAARSMVGDETPPSPSGVDISSPKPTAEGPAKVIVLLRNTGDAPILSPNKFKISAEEKFEKVVAAIKARIGRKQIFVYLNSAFTPRYDETVAKLFKWHGVEGKLVVNYATVPAWG